MPLWGFIPTTLASQGLMAMICPATHANTCQQAIALMSATSHLLLTLACWGLTTIHLPATALQPSAWLHMCTRPQSVACQCSR